MANPWHTIHTGVTNDLDRRVWEHKSGAIPGFTSRYGICNLVYFEYSEDARAAIEREKGINAWRRDKKIRLIESANPGWEDLSSSWYEQPPEQPRP